MASWPRKPRTRTEWGNALEEKVMRSLMSVPFARPSLRENGGAIQRDREYAGLCGLGYRKGAGSLNEVWAGGAKSPT